MFSCRYSIEEDSGTFVIRVLRDQGLVGEVSVVYVIIDGGATNGEDFSAVSLDVSSIIQYHRFFSYHLVVNV